jgi:hypothetical protein
MPFIINLILTGEDNGAIKKKKKSRSKKKNPAVSNVVTVKGQTDPPTIPIVELFPDGNTTPDINYSKVGLGQLKFVFNFRQLPRLRRNGISCCRG